jgi:hypothetical protein
MSVEDAAQAKNSVYDMRDRRRATKEEKERLKREVASVRKFDGAPVRVLGSELIEACKKNIERAKKEYIPQDGKPFIHPSITIERRAKFDVRVNKFAMTHYEPESEYYMPLEQAIEYGLVGSPDDEEVSDAISN